jgi:phage terminase large subunit GpA-like protein
MAEKIGDAKAKDSGQTLLLKEFPAGTLILTGANSPGGLRSMPIRVVLFDEVDGYPASAGSEGDPIMLGKKRTANFWNRKLILGSTPTLKYTSRVDAAWESGTKERWSLPCPSCGAYQQLLWEQMDISTLKCACRYCDKAFDEFEWKADLLKGRWIAEFPNRKKVRSFHMNELGSSFRRWSEIVEDYLEAQEAAKIGNMELMKGFVNTCLGECWESTSETISQEWLEQKREDYGDEIPNEVLYLTCGVDVQDNRLEVIVQGFGAGKESWAIEYHVIHGDPGRNDIWESLNEYLGRYWTREDSADIPISCTCIDSGGHFTDEVYRFVKGKEHRRIFAIKGHATQGKPFIGKPTRSNRRKIALFPINVSVGKETFYSRLRLEEHGAGYCHFPIGKGFTDQVLKGLVSERPTLKYKGTQRVIEWVKLPGVRNEPLDVSVYALAALEILNPNLKIGRKTPAKKKALPSVPEAVANSVTPIIIAPNPTPQPASMRQRRVLSSGVRL